MPTPDAARLRDVDALRHVAAALGDRDARVRDLFAARLRLRHAPDPTEFFARSLARHRALEAPRDAIGLRVLSYNVGLLSRRTALRRFEVPEVHSRRTVLPDRLLADGWDALLLQEVWERSDIALFASAARRHGYAWYAGPRHHSAHGLLALVKRSLVHAGRSVTFSEHRFTRQRRLERVPGVGIQRGFLVWSFVHAELRVPIVFVDTHTTAFPGLHAVRAAQVRQLGRTIAAMDPRAIVIVGGDFNAGPYYAHDVHGERAGRPVRGWWKNALSYPLLLHYGELEDTRVLAAPARDVQLADRLPRWQASHLEAPFGGGSFVPDPEQDTFTVGDHNGLYFRQYGGTEYAARIDHVLVRDRLARIRVLRHRLCYTEPHALGGAGSCELSDHYGVGVDLAIDTAPR